MTKGINYPKGYAEVEDFEGTEHGLPKGSELIVMTSDQASANIIISDITDTNWNPMPFDDAKSIIDDLHESLGDTQGIIEVKNGSLASGGRYVYNIVKQGRDDGEEHVPGIDYIMNMNLENQGKLLFLNAAFFEEGLTGTRDSIFLEMSLREAQKEADANREAFDSVEWIRKNWASDPYDGAFEKGLRMNRSERSEYDSLFPDHPLTLLRTFIAYIIANN